jgi:hypothetical protein
MKPTQYICPKDDGMQLRSGCTINNITTTNLYKEIRTCVVLNNYRYYYPFMADVSYDPYNDTCNTCYNILSLLRIAENYGKELRGETNDIKGDDKEFSTKQYLYIIVRDKINEFISKLDNNKFEICKCILPDYTINKFKSVNDAECIIRDMEYSNMANYTGYGSERALYRKYNRDFVRFLGCCPIDGYMVVVRDFKQIKKELIHWSKFFNQQHCWVIEKNKQITKAVKENINLNEDCRNHILSFIIEE